MLEKRAHEITRQLPVLLEIGKAREARELGFHLVYLTDHRQPFDHLLYSIEKAPHILLQQECL